MPDQPAPPPLSPPDTDSGAGPTGPLARATGTARPRGAPDRAGTPDRAGAGDPAVLALGAIGWLVGDEDRAQRLFDLTGLDPAALRAQAADPTLHAAVLAMIAAHEPDLIACAEALGVLPAALADAAARTNAFDTGAA